MRLTVEQTNDTHATLHIDGDGDGAINIECKNATEVALDIARSVNRDRHFDALVAALTPFRSSEMGAHLVRMIDSREQGGEEAQARLSRLVKMIDVILDAVETAEEDGEPIDA
jgi:hypothetical protein